MNTAGASMPDVFEYSTTATVAEVASALRSAQSVMITSHIKPDGDAMGSTLAMRRALLSMEKKAEIYLFGPLENTLRTVTAGDAIHLDRQPPAADDAFDLILVVDTGSWNQLDPLRAWLKDRRDRIIIIDHHTRGDDLTDVRLIDAKAASTTIVLLELMDELGIDVTNGSRGSIAEALFVGLATDTGWFRYSNAGERAFAAAARLLGTGVEKDRLYQQLEESYSPRRLLLEARSLDSIVYARKGTAAVMALGPEDFKKAGAATGELTGIVNAPMHVAAVRVSILLTEQEPGVTKMSFRSKPSVGDDVAEPVIDVNVLAQQFGGGGHVHAAGARMKCPLAEARDKIVAALDAME